MKVSVNKYKRKAYGKKNTLNYICTTMVPKYLPFRKKYEIWNYVRLCRRVANTELAEKPKCECLTRKGIEKMKIITLCECMGFPRLT